MKKDKNDFLRTSEIVRVRTEETLSGMQETNVKQEKLWYLLIAYVEI